jgi:hypothetical protein
MPEPDREIILKDLDLQWQDHFHMRDQTWKTISNSALLFLGVVGLEFKDVGDLVLIPAYVVLIIIAVSGWAVAAHHRVRQGQKFAFIKKYEEKLGLFELKREIIEHADTKKGLAGKIFTARFIEIMHISIGIVALALCRGPRLFPS